MGKPVLQLLRFVLLVLFLGSLLAQAFVPALASEAARTFPEVGPLVVAYSIAGIVVIACCQVVLFVIWRLLSMISGGMIFTRQSLRWVDIIISSGALATAVNTGVWVHLLVVAGGGPGIILWLLVSLAGGVAFVLLMLVMRGLLELAIADRTELDGVI